MCGKCTRSDAGTSSQLVTVSESNMRISSASFAMASALVRVLVNDCVCLEIQTVMDANGSVSVWQFKNKLEHTFTPQAFHLLVLSE